MDAFALSLSYGLLNINKRKILLVAFVVGIFHFFMPYLGNKCDFILFKYLFIKPRLIVFMVFFLLSINMFISFFEKSKKIKNLNTFGIIMFAISVSLDSFSVGLTLDYITNSLFVSYLIFSIISFVMTIIGFIIGRSIGDKTGKYSYLLGAVLLLVYSFWVLTK